MMCLCQHQEYQHGCFRLGEAPGGGAGEHQTGDLVPRPLGPLLRGPTSNRDLNTSSASQYAATGPRRMAPINGDECFFWRTTGCLYGDKCRSKHKPDHKGRDRKPWQP
ncbi:zinc finger CCCH domain-containing protein 63-like isoform X2 [Oncorhynchus kisutch]|uniref:zinc finger CCCH domain-containing protein 63-like isoform X2 n=1 Tax=Oncorhynchus kisutch TaxID=8019 RepID=UPI0012DFC724|nr:zinc finger CCCH domain-containing protein 63-like isoform X2 [Oncorhynchus kisutch]